MPASLFLAQISFCHLTLGQAWFSPVILRLPRIVCRDIGGSDPERMAPPRVAEYVQEMFKDTVVNVEVLSDDAVFQKEYPLLAAVNRCARRK